MTREVRDEASAFTLRMRFSNGTSPVIPTTVHYRNVDLTNGRTVRDWTAVTAASEVLVDVVASDNEIYNDNRRPKRRYEERAIVVAANKDTDRQYVKEIRYLIKNIRGFDS